MSFSFGVLGLLSATYIILYEPKLRAMYVPAILLFYTTMEFLQGIQYGYVNKCSDKTNILLTEFAYLLVIVQPLMWNVFFYLNSTSCEKSIFMVGIVLAVLWMVVNVSARLTYTPENGQKQKDSIFAGPSSCTKRNASHLFWNWPSANYNDLTANYLMYLLIWFIPGLVSSSFRGVSIVVAIFACIGALMAHLANEVYIFASVWCYISVPMILAMALYIKNGYTKT